MKQLLLWLFLALSITAHAQIPSYYNDVNLSQSGTNLKNELATKVISTHTTFLSYTPGVWNALQQSDVDPNNNSNVLLIYGHNDTDGNVKTDRTRGKFDNGGSVGNWNREHVFAKSLANPSLGTSGAGADAHNLRPCDTQQNSTRSNHKFGAGSGAAGFINSNTDWYPGDEWKGDTARMIMFMYLRYGNRCLPTFVGTGSPVSSDNNMIDLFLQWNVDDPVSAFETQRNNVVAGIQGNRNPFIDNPAFATQIWGGAQAEDKFNISIGVDTEAPTVPQSLVASNTTNSTTTLNWTASSDNVAVTSYEVYQNGVLIGNTSNTIYNVFGLLGNTSYTFTLTAKDAAGNTSNASLGVTVTTTTTIGGGTTELFFSEYVEGSSYNKALEIANFTGNSISLASYTIKKQTNGAGGWSTGYALTGTLANGNVYVLGHSSASTGVTTQATVLTTNSAITFNGNDAVGLFKNGVLIDVIGTFGSSANFGKNVTLRRKATITNPNTTYTTSEWDIYASNTFSGLGTHTINGGTIPDTEAPSIPTNVVASNETQTTINLNWTAATDNVAVVSYEVYNSGTLVTTITSTAYQVTGLTAGTTYTFTIKAKDAAGNVSANSIVVNATTLASGSNENELFFSEYIEGSSNNKALEIANFTGSAVSLSSYTIKKQTNGAGSWSSAYALSGSLSNGNVYVIANSSASTTIINQADVTTGGAIVTFNGNDPVGLFKDNVLIDIIGTFNGGSSNFAQNITLVRKSSITNPNTSYTIAEWDSFSTDTFSNLGSHSVNGGGSPVTPGGRTVLHEGFFESGLDGWVDGGGDCYRYSGSRSYEGNYSMRIRDNSGTASSMTLNDVDVSSYDEVEVEFHFYSYSMETGEDFWLRYHNGSSWQTVRTYVSGTDFQNNNFFSSKVTLSKANYNFVSNAKFRFQADASSNADQIYIDQVTITGIVNAFARMNSESTKFETNLLSAFPEEDKVLLDENFTIYPNPVKHQLEIKIFADATAEYQIHSLLGQIVKVGNLANKTINVANLKAGIYILQINDGDEILTKKFIKK